MACGSASRWSVISLIWKVTKRMFCLSSFCVTAPSAKFSVLNTKGIAAQLKNSFKSNFVAECHTLTDPHSVQFAPPFMIPEHWCLIWPPAEERKMPFCMCSWRELDSKTFGLIFVSVRLFCFVLCHSQASCANESSSPSWNRTKPHAWVTLFCRADCGHQASVICIIAHKLCLWKLGIVNVESPSESLVTDESCRSSVHMQTKSCALQQWHKWWQHQHLQNFQDFVCWFVFIILSWLHWTTFLKWICGFC